MKSTSRNGFGLKEVRPMAPRYNRMGQSPPIRFFCALHQALATKNQNAEKSKKSKSQIVFGLKEVRPNTPRTNRTGQSPPISFCCALYQALPGKIHEKEKRKLHHRRLIGGLWPAILFLGVLVISLDYRPAEPSAITKNRHPLYYNCAIGTEVRAPVL